MTNWRGIFVIVVTPFTESYALDEESLRREVRFCLDAGVHGLVGPANASEFATLSDDERKRWLEIVIEEADGRVPVVATTTSGHAVPTLALSQWAQEAGADSIMLMPPHILHPDAQGCYDYYRTLSDGLRVPIIIQNFMGPIGTPMSSELVARMCRDFEQVQYVKEETFPEPQRISETLAAAGDACRGVFGGQGGSYIIDEYRRGSCGNMPACQAAEVQVAIWEKLEAGDEADARQLFNRLLPLIHLERLYGVAMYKEIFQRRGIFATSLSRSPKATLDDADRRELDDVLADVEPLFKI